MGYVNIDDLGVDIEDVTFNLSLKDITVSHQNKILGKISIEDFQKHCLANYLPTIETPILSNKTIFYKEFYEEEDNKNGKLIVIELPSHKRTIKFLGKKYNIMLPYIQFYCSIIDDYVGKSVVTCSPEPIKSVKDKVYSLYLPNHGDAESGICFGSVSTKSKVNSNSPCDAVIELCSKFLESGFNNEAFPMSIDHYYDDDEGYISFLEQIENKIPKLISIGTFNNVINNIIERPYNEYH